ncbi:hypothetical protein COY07_02985 [Candidatus Peregrinibacteria bacterium CG_4_10_14_0_2_um_filter_43_11]|nr:MAG: hypothetical protein COY07_02985 [Candidatus Peregrinibacteria bacterium CG_4_10_14_0_2_um_filter_43_11]
MGDKNQKITSFTLALALLALTIALFSLLGGQNKVDDTTFNGRVEKGIEAFIQKQQEAAAPQAKRVAEAVKNTIEDDDAMEGDKNAPVTLIEFSDYECPFCGRFFSETLPQITKKYIDSGKVKMVYRDFPLGFHANARPAAIASNCAREQGGDKTYFLYHNLLYGNQQDLSEEALQKYAADLNLDANKFASCLTSGKFDAEIDADSADGQASGISGTPAFLMLVKKDESKVDSLKAMELSQNGEYIIQYIETEDGKRMGLRISGAHPYSTFEKAIEIGL